MRCFIAVTVGERITGPVAGVAGELRAAAEAAGAGLRISWTRPEGWHVTLKFLGEIERPEQMETTARQTNDRLDAISSAVGRVASSHSAFDVRAAGVMTLPRSSSPRVIAVGIHDDGSLANLAADVDAAMEPFGFGRERRRFTPHLTLGRIRHAGSEWATMRPAVEAMRDMDLGTDSVREVGLFESELGPGGARYVRRAGFRLND